MTIYQTYAEEYDDLKTSILDPWIPDFLFGSLEMLKLHCWQVVLSCCLNCCLERQSRTHL